MENKNILKIELDGYVYLCDLSSRVFDEDINSDTRFFIDVTLELNLKGEKHSFDFYFEISKYRFLHQIQDIKEKLLIYKNSNLTGENMFPFGTELIGRVIGYSYPMLEFCYCGRNNDDEEKKFFEIIDNIEGNFFSTGDPYELIPFSKFTSRMNYQGVMNFLAKLEELCHFPSKKYDYWTPKLMLNQYKTNKKEVLFDALKKLYKNENDKEKIYQLLLDKDLFLPLYPSELSYIHSYLLDRGFEYLDPFLIKLYRLYIYALNLFDSEERESYKHFGSYFQPERLEKDFWTILEMIESDEFKNDNYLSLFSTEIKNDLKKFTRYRPYN